MRSMVEGPAMLKDIAPKGRARSVRHARSLRAEMTLPEVLMWKALRNQPNGLKFRRQHPSGPYILDFFCSDARLAIEIDPLITHTMPLDDINRAFDLMHAGESIRSVVIY